MQELYNNKHMQEVVTELFTEMLDEEAKRRAKKGEANTGLKEAYEMIPQAWRYLEQMFGQETKPNVTNYSR